MKNKYSNFKFLALKCSVFINLIDIDISCTSNILRKFYKKGSVFRKFGDLYVRGFLMKNYF
jgi:hypothetical protein